MLNARAYVMRGFLRSPTAVPKMLSQEHIPGFRYTCCSKVGGGRKSLNSLNNPQLCLSELHNTTQFDFDRVDSKNVRLREVYFSENF